MKFKFIWLRSILFTGGNRVKRYTWGSLLSSGIQGVLWHWATKPQIKTTFTHWSKLLHSLIRLYTRCKVNIFKEHQKKPYNKLRRLGVHRIYIILLLYCEIQSVASDSCDKSDKLCNSTTAVNTRYVTDVFGIEFQLAEIILQLVSKLNYRDLQLRLSGSTQNGQNLKWTVRVEVLTFSPGMC